MKLEHETSATSEFITPYCFGDLGSEARFAFELHLLECDACWRELQRLEAAIHEIRNDPKFPEMFLTPEAVSLFGLSSRLRHLFGGHGWFVFAAAVLYALLYSVSAIFEVLFRFEVYGKTATVFAVFICFPWIAATALAAHYLDWKRTERGLASGGYLSSVSTIGAAIAVVGMAAMFLPHVPVTDSARAYPAIIAYLKDTLYYLPYQLVFVSVPFHLVIAMQRQLVAGKYEQVLKLLVREPYSLVPRGTLFIPVWINGLLLAAIGLLSVYLTTNLFDQLTKGTHTLAFMYLIHLRNFCYFALGVVGLVWYARRLEELKAECLAVISLRQRGHRADHILQA